MALTIPSTTRRYCSDGHIHQTKPEFIPCCPKAQPTNSDKTHCPQGHEYTGRNTLQYRGHRYCRTCRRQQKRLGYIKNKVRSFVRLRDGGRCRYCGERGGEVDHVVARCNGGAENAFSNLVWSCKSCNSTKGSEEGFTMQQERLLWRGRLVAPEGLFGAHLMEEVKAQRRDRQIAQGLMHLVEFKGGAS